MSSPDGSTEGAPMNPPARRDGAAGQGRALALGARLAVVFALSGALAGCFQPLYAENATVGGPALMDRMQDVEVVQIQGRLGNSLRDDLIFSLTGGKGNPKGAPYQLIISVDSKVNTALVNSGSGLPENQIVQVNAKWYLVKADDKARKPIVSNSAFDSATIDVSDQRYANYAARQDAESRAARGVAEQIKIQLAAYFIRTDQGVAIPQRSGS